MNRLRRLRLYAVEKLTLIYIIITFVIAVCFLLINHFPVGQLLLMRLIISSTIIFLAYLSSFTKNKFIIFIRFAFIGGLLIYWYPETFEFNRYLINHDNLFALFDQHLFGFQPSLLFAERYPQKFIDEMMNMGYFSYYPLIVIPSAVFYFKDRKLFHPYFFIILFSFFAYYIFFILYQTAGPQYYFEVIGYKNVSAGNFPQIGNYFLSHKIEPLQGQTGFFDSLVNISQYIGERPTAAFPSSHVGISTLIMYMLIRYKKYTFAGILFPLYIILVMSTVYIQAHYFVDTVAGFFSAFLLYFLGNKIFFIKLNSRPKSDLKINYHVSSR